MLRSLFVELAVLGGLDERQCLVGRGLDDDVVQAGQGAGGQPGEDIVAGIERVQARDGVRQCGGRVGGDGLAEQVSLVPLVGGDQRGVVPDRVLPSIPLARRNSVLMARYRTQATARSGPERGDLAGVAGRIQAE